MIKPTDTEVQAAESTSQAATPAPDEAAQLAADSAQANLTKHTFRSLLKPGQETPKVTIRGRTFE